MDYLAAMFDDAAMRFATSGTLITVYMIADRLVARRRCGATQAPKTTRAVGLVIALSLTGFYVLIGPTGGALWGGIGNVVGIALAGSAVVVRIGHVVRYPSLGGRGLLYLSLPIATGVPWGLLVLSLPAYITSGWCCVKAERAPARVEPGAPSYRLVPGVW